MDFGDDTDFGEAPAQQTEAPAFETDNTFGGFDAPAAAAPSSGAVDFGGDDDFLGGGQPQQQQHEEEQQQQQVEEEEEPAFESQPAEAAAAPSSNDFDDDFLGGGNNNAAPAPAPAADAGGFDDFMGESAAPAAAIPAPAADSTPAASTPASSTPRNAIDSLEENPFTVWQKQHQIHLQKKSDESRARNDEAKAKATQWIQDFYQERSLKFDKVQRVNRDNEKEAIIALENALVTGPSWERVCGLVDLQAKTDARDTTRMRQVLLQVKAHPPAHMQTA